MDESAIKGLELNGSDLDALKARKSRSVRLLVKGYDTSVHVDSVKSALREHFSSCGEIVCVSNSYYEDGTPTRIAEIYIMGDGAEEKALQLSGSEMGGRKLVVTSLSTDCIKLTPEMAARLARAERVSRSKMILVKGFDTSLPEDDIKSALTNHFSSCGEVLDFTLCPDEIPCPIRAPTCNNAIISILGEGAEEKALQLNGSDMGGRNLVVVPCYTPSKVTPRPRPGCVYGYTVPARFTNPKKKKKKTKTKTGLNRKKTRK